MRQIARLARRRSQGLKRLEGASSVRIMTGTYVGLDVGAREVHGIALGQHGELVDLLEVDAGEPDTVRNWAAGAKVIAIDSPDRLSTAPHGADGGLAIAPKFRNARCAEIGLLKIYRLQVPWVTPVGEPVAEWMQVGIALFELLRRAGQSPIEVFPDSAFRRLAGQLGPLEKKGTRAGSAQRAALLARAGMKGTRLALWSTHGIDAAMASVLARMSVSGEAIPATCGHDGSAIWIPKSSVI